MFHSSFLPCSVFSEAPLSLHFSLNPTKEKKQYIPIHRKEKRCQGTDGLGESDIWRAQPYEWVIHVYLILVLASTTSALPFQPQAAEAPNVHSWKYFIIFFFKLPNLECPLMSKICSHYLI